MKILVLSIGLALGILCAQTAPDLTTALRPLAYFRGAWSCQGQFANGKAIAADVTFAPDLKGAWLSYRHDDRPPNPYHALGMWGFDKNEREFVFFAYDSSGGARLFAAPGWVGDRLVWTGDRLASSAGTTEHFIFDRKSDTVFAMTYEVKKGVGVWTPVDSITCTKKSR